MNETVMSENTTNGNVTNGDAIREAGPIPSENPVSPSAAPAQPPAAAYGAYPYAPNRVTYAAPQVKKPPFAVSGKDYGFAAAFLLLCIAVVAMGLFGELNLGFTLSYGALFLALTAFLKRPGVLPGPFGWTCGALALVSTASYWLYSDFQIKFFMSIAVCCLSAVWFYELSGRKEEKGDFGLVINLFEHTAGNTVTHFGESYRGLLFSGNRKGVGKALIGALCALPVAAVAVTLLVKADGAFEALTVTLLENSFLLLVKIGLGLFAGVFVIAFALGLRKTEPQPQKNPAPGRLDTVYAAAFTAVLCLCYCFYLFSQLAYFFDAFRGMIPEGYEISFSDYARQGFFELCWIAGINFVVVFAALALVKPKNGRLPMSVKITCTFICLFTLLVIATAVAKMVMYINEYGMTQLRVRTGLFMCFIVAVFVALSLRLYLPKVRVLRVALLGASVALLVLGAGNDNAFIARYNDAVVYKDNPGYSAVEEQAELGPEGVPYLIEFAKSSNRALAQKADEALRNLRYEYYEYNYDYDEYIFEEREATFDYNVKTQSGFNKYNVFVARAYEALDAYFTGEAPVAERLTESTTAPTPAEEETTEPTTR